jgi:hypothetical protein
MNHALQQGEIKMNEVHIPLEKLSGKVEFIPALLDVSLHIRLGV